MLVLTRKQGTGIVLKTKSGDIFVKLVEVKGRQVRIGIEAGRDVLVLRDELDIDANKTKGGAVW